MTIQAKPLAMGGLMGLMMLWMLHGQLAENTTSTPALLVFVGAHVVIITLLLGASIFAARLSPRLRHMIDKMHRPSFWHLGWMFAGAAGSAGTIHFAIHGVG